MPSRRLVVALLLLLATTSAGAQSRRSEGAFRQSAVERVMPTFPGNVARAQSSGVVVLQVTVETSGDVGDVVIRGS